MLPAAYHYVNPLGLQLATNDADLLLQGDGDGEGGGGSNILSLLGPLSGSLSGVRFRSRKNCLDSHNTPHWLHIALITGLYKYS
jgi:hypothetical protein